MVSKRITTMTVQLVTDACVTVVWAGDTWAYRGALDAAGVPGPCVKLMRGRGSERVRAPFAE